MTGLPNRVLFIDLLERAIQRTTRHPEQLFALLVLGLDRFETLNASLGLVTADRLLVDDRPSPADAAVHRRAGADGPGGQGYTLARLAGDEFTVLVEDIDDASDAARVAERLRAALERPVRGGRTADLRVG